MPQFGQIVFLLILRLYFDGIITQRLVELAETKGVKTLVGLKKAKLERKGKVNVYAMN